MEEKKEEQMGVLLNIFNVIFNVYLVAFILRFVINIMIPEFYNQFIQMLNSITEPVIMPIRNWWKWLPISAAIKFDPSPLLACLVLSILKFLVIKGIGFLMG